VDCPDGAVRPAESRQSSADALELRLPDGPSIVVRPGFDRSTLRALLETLRTTAVGAEANHKLTPLTRPLFVHCFASNTANQWEATGMKGMHRECVIR
jgi:hypothetical protein